MTGLIIGTIIVVAVLLVLVVLAQNPKSSGSGGGLTFSGANQLMGAKRSADLFEKMTWGFIATIMVLALAANVAIKRPSAEEQFSSPNVEAAKSTNVPTPAATSDSLAKPITPTETTQPADTTKK